MVGDTPEKEQDALLAVGENKMIVKSFGMEAVFEILEEEEEVDGENMRKTFKRHERFLDYVPFLADFGIKILLWDQTWTYGFRRLDNGKLRFTIKGNTFMDLGPFVASSFFTSAMCSGHVRSSSTTRRLRTTRMAPMNAGRSGWNACYWPPNRKECTQVAEECAL